MRARRHPRPHVEGNNNNIAASGLSFRHKGGLSFTLFRNITMSRQIGVVCHQTYTSHLHAYLILHFPQIVHKNNNQITYSFVTFCISSITRLILPFSCFNKLYSKISFCKSINKFKATLNLCGQIEQSSSLYN